MNDEKLHPRLSRGYATIRWDALRELDPAAARTHTEAGVPDEVTWTATGAARITRRELGLLRESLVEAVDHLPFGEPLSVTERDEFDRAVTRVYAEHSKLFPAEASNIEVWSYHALVLAPDLALWRWRHRPVLNIERFIGSDLTRHTFGRLWWRWYTFTSGRLDDDHGWALLDGLGEADVDQLQSRRSAYGVDPPIIRALAEIYLEVKERAAATQLGSRDIWRDLLQRLLRRGAFVSFSALPPGALKAAAREQLNVTIEALSNDAGEPPQRDTRSTTWASFDEVPLSHLVVAVAESVDDAGVLADVELPDAVEAHLAVAVPGRFRAALSGFAWMADALGYVRRDESAELWRLGSKPPALDRRWGDWTLAAIRDAAMENGGVDEDLIGSVFLGRAGKTVRLVIWAAAA